MKIIKKILCSALILLPHAAQTSLSDLSNKYPTDLPAVTSILSKNPSLINSSDRNGNTCIEWAASKGNYAGFLAMLQPTASVIDFTQVNYFNDNNTTLQTWSASGKNTQIINLYDLLSSGVDYALFMQYLNYLVANPTVSSVTKAKSIPNPIPNNSTNMLQQSNYIPSGNITNKADIDGISSVFGIPLSKATLKKTNTNLIQYGPNPCSYSLNLIEVTEQNLTDGAYLYLNTPTAKGITYSLYDKNGIAISKTPAFLKPSPIANAGGIVTGSPIGYMLQVTAPSSTGLTQLSDLNTPMPSVTVPGLFFLQYAPKGTVIFPAAPKKPKNTKKLKEILKHLETDASASTSAIFTFDFSKAPADGTAAINAEINVIVDLYDLINKTNPKLAQQLPTSIQTLTKPA